MPDVRYSLSSSSGNQKCENKPYTLKETLSLKKKKIQSSEPKRKKKVLCRRKNIHYVRVTDMLFYVNIFTAICQGCENRRQNKKAGGQVHTEKFKKFVHLHFFENLSLELN